MKNWRNAPNLPIKLVDPPSDIRNRVANDSNAAKET
jgi:hypothetical protein